MKPIVRYKQLYIGLRLGESACVELAEAHPNSDVRTPQVTTSSVVSISSNGDFETLNTHYVKDRSNG